MIVRPAVEADVDAIAGLRARAGGAAVDPVWCERVRAALRDPGAPVTHVVAVGDAGAGPLLGWLAVGEARDADVDRARVGELWAVYVAPEAWGRGVGHALHRHACERLRAAGRSEMVLWVLPGNARARAFYERQGMRADGAEKVDHGERHVRYRVAL
jgi:ribosomal protein S18 acetylase RimI-like enzyme